MNSLIRSKVWRDSASLIVLSKQNCNVYFNEGKHKFDVLMQTRTSSGTFKDTSVFPGGVAEHADSICEWLKLFKSFGYCQLHFDDFRRAGSPTTPIFQENSLRPIGLRITAIRETFEELGILICSRKHCDNKDYLWADVVNDIDFKYWRNEVSVNPQRFLSLCIEHKCYPDIWSLHYWSNWMTPAFQSKRFDTAFFVTALENKPGNIEGNSEVISTEWSTPQLLLDKSVNKEVKLPPPQIYELSRLSEFNEIQEVINFARNRQCQGDELYFPVIVYAKDGVVHALPGDSLYPLDVDYVKGKLYFEDKTVSQLEGSDPTQHRFIPTESKLVINNFVPSNNHINMGNKNVQFHN